MSGLIAIVGRPNVGKSALFNRIVGKRIAIVHDEPGVTRDRVTAEGEWRGQPFTLVDTGGIGLLRGEKAADVLSKAAMQQVELAIEAAHAIILVVNVQEGIVPLDREVADRLRRSNKPILLAVNKVDNTGAERSLPEFTELGFPRVYAVSAIHGSGIEPLMDAASSFLPALPAVEALPGAAAGKEPPVKLAIIGRPNVGKSSLINALTKSERVIVSPIPGTTRDSVDVPFDVETDGTRQHYLLIDTAGIRKTRRVADSVEFFSVKRSESTIQRSDIAVFVLDAEAGILEQDKKIADLITEAKKACIIVVNKWDLVKEAVEEAQEQAALKKRSRHERGPKANSFQTFAEWVQDKMFFLDYAPVIFTSALSGFHLDRLLEAVRYVAAQLKQKIPTALVNRTLHDAIERRQPISSGGFRLKFFYATQIKEQPPTFLMFVNRVDLFTDRYAKYLADQMRTAFGYEGCPIVLLPRARTRSEEREEVHRTTHPTRPRVQRPPREKGGHRGGGKNLRKRQKRR